MSTVARILLGLAFVVFSLNYFVPFLPEQAPPPAAMPFLGAFVASGFLALVKSIELAAGLLLLANRFVPLALALLAPILVGISAFHILLAPSGLPVPLVLVALEVVLAWAYRDAFAPMLHARTAARPITTSKTSAGVAVTAGVAS
jgi:uncharacterized membrane protein (UPF0136 family)